MGIDDANPTARKKLEECLQRQTVPSGKAFAVGPTDAGYRSYLIRVAPSIEPADCKTVSVNPHEAGEPPSVLIQFTPSGARKLSDLTSTWVGQLMALVVGDMVYSALLVMTEITGGSATVTLGPGQSGDDAKALANTIAEGSPALPRPGVRTFGRAEE
jgi:preprotein translocase subunit SecD